MTPEEYCQQKAAASGSSFYYSFLFLPRERRRAITALYAFCREVDDAVDESSDPHLAATKLAWWRSEIANLFAGDPQHPVTRGLAPDESDIATPETAPTLRQRSIPAPTANRGMSGDRTGPPQRVRARAWPSTIAPAARHRWPSTCIRRSAPRHRTLACCSWRAG